MTNEEMAAFERLWQNSPSWAHEHIPKLLMELKKKDLQIQELQKGYAGFTAEEWFGKHGQMNSDRLDLIDKLKESNRLISEMLAALDRVHDTARCPMQSKCWACNVLKKHKDQIPDQHLAVCSVCKELIEDTFAARKAAWCEKCEGYSHNNCWGAHNLTYCKAIEKRKGAGCDCGATIAFPAHQPGCFFGGPYDLPV